MKGSIPASGDILDLVGVCVNRIGKVETSAVGNTFGADRIFRRLKPEVWTN